MEFTKVFLLFGIGGDFIAYLILWSLSKLKFYLISKFEKPSTVQTIQVVWFYYCIFSYKRTTFCIQNINLFEYFRRWISMFASFSFKKFCCSFLTRRFVILAVLIGLQATPGTNTIKREAILIKFISVKSICIFRWNYFDLSFSFVISVFICSPVQENFPNFESRRILLSFLLTSILEFGG